MILLFQAGKPVQGCFQVSKISHWVPEHSGTAVKISTRFKHHTTMTTFHYHHWCPPVNGGMLKWTTFVVVNNTKCFQYHCSGLTHRCPYHCSNHTCRCSMSQGFVLVSSPSPPGPAAGGRQTAVGGPCLEETRQKWRSWEGAQDVRLQMQDSLDNNQGFFKKVCWTRTRVCCYRSIHDKVKTELLCVLVMKHFEQLMLGQVPSFRYSFLFDQ